MASKKPKTISLSFRVPIEEREALEKSAVEAGTTLAAYIYSTLVEARSGNKPVVAVAAPAPAEPPPRVAGISLSDPDALAQLKRIGININQLAHATNAGQPPSQRNMVDAFAGLFGLLSEPERFMRKLAEVKAPVDAPAEPSPDQVRLSAMSRDLETRDTELRSLAGELDAMRKRESAMRDRIAQLESSLAKAQAPKMPLPLPASKPPVVPPSPPKPATSPPPRSVSSEPARAIPAQPSRNAPPAALPTYVRPAPPPMRPTPPKPRFEWPWRREKSATVPARPPVPPARTGLRPRSLKMRVPSEAPRHDSPNPQARYELQDGRGVHSPRPAKRDERPGRLGFLRKLWEG